MAADIAEIALDGSRAPSGVLDSLRMILVAQETQQANETFPDAFFRAA